MLPPINDPESNLTPEYKLPIIRPLAELSLLDLTTAMKNREFFFHFQPIFDLQSSGQVGSEMLVRWMRNGEVWLPPRFFPLLERHNLLKSLDHYVVQRVHELDWGFILHPDFKFRVFINAFSETLVDPNFLILMEAVAQRMQAIDLVPVIEVSERSLFEPDILTKNLVRLRKMGIEVALDDFGSGHSSLARLVNLPLDILKIDGHFSSTIGISPRGEVVLDSILTLASNIGLKTVVEGVETQTQADWLRQHTHCWVQGYYFGYPLPANYGPSTAQ